MDFNFALFKPYLKETPIYRLYICIRNVYDVFKWCRFKKCSPPSPYLVKSSILVRHGIKNSSWVETGTYKGGTTSILAKRYPLVHTIEPSKECFKIASLNLRNYSNICLHLGTSEECLEEICKSLKGDISFWLDGHYSKGDTFKGTKVTPIIYELETISNYISKYKKVLILIDDIRLSHTKKQNYPSLDFYVDWAKSNNLSWTIEQDIFIMKSLNLKMYP